MLEGQRAGYLKSYFGARKAAALGTIVHLNAGDKLSDLQLNLWPHCIVSGKVLDENGQPVSTQIYALEETWFRGHRQYLPQGAALTSNEGEYRISHLRPGRYVLHATPTSERFVEQQGQPEKGLVPIFYPDSQTLDGATVFEIVPGQDVTGINFQMHTAPVFHVRGRVDVSVLSNRENLQVNAVRQGLIADLSLLSGAIKTDGSFDIAGVSAGSYDLRICGGGEYQCTGNQAVDVADADVSGLVIGLPSLVQVRGRVRDASRPRSFGGIQTSLEQTGTALNEGYFAAVEPDGTFIFRDVSPGNYVLNVLLTGETDYVKSILYDQRDVLGVPADFSAGAACEVQIIVSKGAGQVEGTVQVAYQQEGRAENASSGSIEAALVSERPRQDNGGVLFARTDQNRHFSFKKVPPGKYYAFAFADVESGVWENREFIAQIQESGKEVEVPEGGRMQIQLPVLAASDIDRAISRLGP
jgi:hypothetical protein